MIDLLLEPRNVGLAGSLLGFITPLFSVVIFLILLPRSLAWLRWGLFWVVLFSGPLLVILWHMFNAVEDWLGLDHVFAALINLIIFCGVGVVIALVIWLTPLKSTSVSQENEQDNKGE